jgi:hypothetical protein
MVSVRQLGTSALWATAFAVDTVDTIEIAINMKRAKEIILRNLAFV